MDAIANDIDYYKKHRTEFIDQYAGKYMVIKNMCIIGVYDTLSTANEETLRSHPAGSFIIERPMLLKKK